MLVTHGLSNKRISTTLLQHFYADYILKRQCSCCTPIYAWRALHFRSCIKKRHGLQKLHHIYWEATFLKEKTSVRVHLLYFINKITRKPGQSQIMNCSNVLHCFMTYFRVKYLREKNRPTRLGHTGFECKQSCFWASESLTQSTLASLCGWSYGELLSLQSLFLPKHTQDSFCHRAGCW